jgi:hypothetical protein
VQIWQSISLPLSALVRKNFASIFASLLPLHSHGTSAEQEKAGAVLQVDMLAAAELTEDERDTLIRKHMVGIDSLLPSMRLAVLLLAYFFDHLQSDFENP